MKTGCFKEQKQGRVTHQTSEHALQKQCWHGHMDSDSMHSETVIDTAAQRQSAFKLLEK